MDELQNILLSSDRFAVHELLLKETFLNTYPNHHELLNICILFN